MRGPGTPWGLLGGVLDILWGLLGVSRDLIRPLGGFQGRLGRIWLEFGGPIPPPWAKQWAPKSMSNHHGIDVEDMHGSRPHYEGQIKPFWDVFGSLSGPLDMQQLLIPS